jgi:hypothetical protein
MVKPTTAAIILRPSSVACRSLRRCQSWFLPPAAWHRRFSLGAFLGAAWLAIAIPSALVAQDTPPAQPILDAGATRADKPSRAASKEQRLRARVAAEAWGKAYIREDFETVAAMIPEKSLQGLGGVKKAATLIKMKAPALREKDATMVGWQTAWPSRLYRSTDGLVCLVPTEMTVAIEGLPAPVINSGYLFCASQDQGKTWRMLDNYTVPPEVVESYVPELTEFLEEYAIQDRVTPALTGARKLEAGGGNPARGAPEARPPAVPTPDKSAQQTSEEDLEDPEDIGNHTLADQGPGLTFHLAELPPYHARLQPAAKAGDPLSRYLLAQSVWECEDLFGDTSKPPYQQEAWQKLQKLAELGQPDAQALVASIYLKGEYEAQDLKQALHWYRLAAETGHVSTQVTLADLLLPDGSELPTDEAYALKLLNEAIKVGYLDAHVSWGRYQIKKQREGKEAGLTEARCLLELAAAKGSPYAAEEIAALTLLSDKTKGMELMKDAALESTGMALLTLAHAYETGTDLPKDPISAAVMYRLADEVAAGFFSGMRIAAESGLTFAQRAEVMKRVRAFRPRRPLLQPPPKDSASILKKYPPKASGTAFCFRGDGRLLTSAAMAKAGRHLRIVTPTGIHVVSVLKVDESTGLALLMLDKGYPCLPVALGGNYRTDGRHRVTFSAYESPADVAEKLLTAKPKVHTATMKDGWLDVPYHSSYSGAPVCHEGDVCPIGIIVPAGGPGSDASKCRVVPLNFENLIDALPPSKDYWAMNHTWREDLSKEDQDLHDSLATVVVVAYD